MSGEDMPRCGEWRLVREIGRGAYGVVYLANSAVDSWAAVKVCRRDEVGEERYRRELRGARLYSTIPPQEGLVHISALVEKPWGFYAVMYLADDEFDRPNPDASVYRPKTLASVISGVKALPLGECVKLGISLAKGLETLQRHHLLHRDIKPSNVIYVEGRPALSDYGLVVDEGEAASLVGTPGYVPPENYIAAAGDIYSLGLTLKAASFGRGIEDIDKGPALEADTGSSFFPAWWRILNKATDRDPRRRYQSAKALWKDLKRLHMMMSVALITRSWMFYVAIAVFLLSVGSCVYIAFGKRADKAAQDAWGAVMGNAYRGTYDGISEEELSFLVDIARRETFGGIVSEEEEDKAKKIRCKGMGIDKMLDDLKESVESVVRETRRRNKSLTNDIPTLQQ